MGKYNLGLSKDLAIQPVNPQQALAVSYYRNPKSETFGNLARSMIKAGFKSNYAYSCLGKMKSEKPIHWLSQAVRQDVALIQKAENNLNKDLALEIDWSEKNAADKARIRAKATEFVLGTLASDKYNKAGGQSMPNIQINITSYSKEEEPGPSPVAPEDFEVVKD